MSDVETRIAEIDQTLREKLLEVQKKDDPRSLSVKEPGKWLQIAAALTTTPNIRAIREHFKTDFYTVKRIEREIMPSIEEFRLREAMNTEVSWSMMGDAIRAKMEKIAQAGDFDEKEAKAIKEMTVSKGLLLGASTKLRGGADMVVEHRKAKTPEEYAKDLEAFMRENIQEAEVIES